MNYDAAQNFVNKLCIDYHVPLLDLKIVKNNSVNARLCSTKNIIKVTNNDFKLSSQLLKALLAHEVGHQIIYCAHHFNLFDAALCLWLFLIAISLLLMPGFLIKILCCVIITACYACLRAFIFRHNEYRADYFSAEVVGFNNITTLLTHAAHIDHTDQAQELLSRHPSVQNRIQYLHKFS